MRYEKRFIQVANTLLYEINWATVLAGATGETLSTSNTIPYGVTTDRERCGVGGYKD